MMRGPGGESGSDAELPEESQPSGPVRDRRALPPAAWAFVRGVTQRPSGGRDIDPASTFERPRSQPTPVTAHVRARKLR